MGAFNITRMGSLERVLKLAFSPLETARRIDNRSGRPKPVESYQLENSFNMHDRE